MLLLLSQNPLPVDPPPGEVVDLRNGWVGTPTGWRKAEARYVGVNGGWSTASHRWVGDKGRWRLHWNIEAASATAQRIADINAYGGTVAQGDFQMRGPEFITPFSNEGTFAYYRLGGTYGDSFENFSSCQPVGTPTVVSAIGRRHIRTTGAQAIRAPQDASGYPMDGLVGGVAGLATWTMGLAFNLDALPAAGRVNFFLFAGTTTNGVGLGVNSAGEIVYMRKAGASVVTKVFAGTFITADSWHGLAVFHVHNDTAQQKVYLDGVLLGTMVTHLTVPGDGAAVNAIYVGYGAYTISGVVAGLDYVNGTFSNWRISNTNDIADAVLLSSTRELFLRFTNAVGAVVNCSNMIVSLTPTGLIFNMPALIPGAYWMTVGDALGESNRMPILIHPLDVQVGALTENWTDPEVSVRTWMAARMQWGGVSGGVVDDNVAIQNNRLILEAHGDNYAGPVNGVNNRGVTVAGVTRVGAAAVSRKYFGPGSFEFELILPPLTGASTAVWTFHYEEAYPTDANWAAFLAEGLGISGTLENGQYIVRNHEIDIELPVAAPGDLNLQNASFLNCFMNNWRGEREGEYTSERLVHGISPGTDGLPHLYRFDWHLDGTPRVEYYVDNVLITTITTHIPDIPMRVWIGYWFPSAAVKWAGATAPWSKQWMQCLRFAYTPFDQTGVRAIGETYPLNYYRPIDINRVLPAP